MSGSLSFTAADDDQWAQFDALAARSYGHPVADITHLRPHADLRVALRDGRVVAGGLGLLVPQFFGGEPVPSACLAAGCVAPEERGRRLAAGVVTERLRALQEQGAVISAISTTSGGYARAMGWEAPTPVFAWSVPALDLTVTNDGVDVQHGTTAGALEMQHDVARRWNGPVDRPDWWTPWKQAKSDLDTYRFGLPGQPPTGLLTFATKRRQRHGVTVTVHDFWAADSRTAAAMLAFLGRHSSRADTIDFRRGALPPGPLLLHNLPRFRLHAQAWHPWMLRILDIPQAVRLRGWPASINATVPIEIDNEQAVSPDRYLFQLIEGKAELSPTRLPGKITFTRRQLAAWYAGGYRTAVAARLAGVHAESDHALAMLIRCTSDTEPWLPDHF